MEDKPVDLLEFRVEFINSALLDVELQALDAEQAELESRIKAIQEKKAASKKKQKLLEARIAGLKNCIKKPDVAKEMVKEWWRTDEKNRKSFEELEKDVQGYLKKINEEANDIEDVEEEKGANVEEPRQS